MKGRRLGIGFLIAFLAAAPLAFGATPTVEELVNRVDQLYRSRTSYAEVEMTIVTPHWTRTLRLDVWTEGMEKTFIRIKSPKKEAGMATLRVGTEMWNYFPKIDKVMKVPPSMMMGSWMGSDFTNDDLVKESSLIRDYDAVLAESDEPDTYTLVLTPRAQTPSVWGKIVLSIDRESLLPVREEFFDEKGNATRILEFKDVKDFDGRKLPSVLELVPLTKEGHRTVIRYLKAEFDRPLDANLFTTRNLRRRR